MTQTQRRLDPGVDFAYLGKKGIEFGGIDIFPTPKGVSIVRITSDEVTSMCPITSQPDFEVVDVTYSPKEHCIESKAWKMYLHSLRDTAGFIESLAADIARVVVEAIEPNWVRVTTTQKARGGISIVAVAILEQDDGGRYMTVDDTAAIYSPPRNFYLEH